MAASVPTPRRGPRSRPRGEGLASTPRGGHRGLPPSENIAPALGTKFIVQAHPDQNVLCHKRSCPSPSSLSSPARAGRGRLQRSALSARRESHTRTWSQPTAPADTADSAMRGRKERSQRARRAGRTGRCWKGLQRRVSCPRPCGRALPLSQRSKGGVAAGSGSLRQPGSYCVCTCQPTANREAPRLGRCHYCRPQPSLRTGAHPASSPGGWPPGPGPRPKAAGEGRTRLPARGWDRAILGGVGLGNKRRATQASRGS